MGGILLAIFMGFIFGYCVMLLWNWVMPGIFDGVKVITYWQAVGLVLLARLLFGAGGQTQYSHHDEWRGRVGCSRNRDYWEDHKYYAAWWRAEGKQALKVYAARVKKVEQPAPKTRDEIRDEPGGGY
jgi:hypothetical protein